MGRYTPCYGQFLSRLAEVETLRALAREKERQDAIKLRGQINALCRSSIVLLSSHVEAYVRDVGERSLEIIYTQKIDRKLLSPRLFYHISKDVIDEIKNTTDHERLAEKIFSFLSDDADFWSKSGPFSGEIPAGRFNKGFSNPAFDKVKSYFNRFGYDRYKQDLYGVLGANANVTITMLNHLVKTRNDIAHGDLTATETPKDLAGMIALTTQFCRTTDKVFADWWKTKQCLIR